MKVLYIGGFGRSGSTLLDMLVGQLDGFFSTGELHSLWKRGIAKRRVCGCGLPVPDCPVWSSILRSGFGESEAPEKLAVRMMRWQADAVKLRKLPNLLGSQQGHQLSPESLEMYVHTSAQLYRAISEVSGARVIVNSSKYPQEAAALRLVPGIEPYFVHLVRDPRAVAYSNQRKVTLQEGAGVRVNMPRSSAGRSATGWLRVNIASEAVKRRYGVGRFMLVRYEDLVAEPRSTLEAIARLLREPFEGLEISDHFVTLRGNHTVWGNSARFRTGQVEIKNDDEWRNKLSTLDRSIATGIALPLLVRYQYAIASLADAPSKLRPSKTS
jgi:Sulfotransferase family